LAVLVTLVFQDILGWWWIVIGLLAGSAIGAVLAVKVRMTAMPELVGFFNGLGGGASLLVAGAELHRAGGLPASALPAVAIAGIIGAVTLTGSLIAFIKLREMKWVEKIVLPGHIFVNGALALLVTAASVLFIMQGDAWTYWVIVLLALTL